MKYDGPKTKLAIIVPYYKIEHFSELLEALKNQTDQNFNVYIGDDCSPRNPREIIDGFINDLNITYRRFDENLGGKDLVAEWNRCLGLIADEEWVWMLPDDDLPSENAVEVFYENLACHSEKNVKVFRLPLNLMDDEGEIFFRAKRKERLLENNYDFYMEILQGERASSLGDYIYHRQSFVAAGGFVNFPKAWLSDHATVIRAAAGGFIYYLESAALNFRVSGQNISSDFSDGLEKIKSRILFAEWLKDNEHLFPEKPEDVFYRLLYWKGEYYVLHQWPWQWAIFVQMYRLRSVCFGRRALLPIIKLALKKIFMNMAGKK